MIRLVEEQQPINKQKTTIHCGLSVRERERERGGREREGNGGRERQDEERETMMMMMIMMILYYPLINIYAHHGPNGSFLRIFTRADHHGNRERKRRLAVGLRCSRTR